MDIETMKKVCMDVGLKRPATGYTAEMRAYRTKVERDYAARVAENPKTMMWIPE